jgi:hypothetical protein
MTAYLGSSTVPRGVLRTEDIMSTVLVLLLHLLWS